MKMQRLIAILLCAMMLVSLLPAAVFAEEAEDEEIVEISFEAEEQEEILPEEPAEEETAEEPAEEEEIPEVDEELPGEEISGDEELAAEPETEAAENEFEVALTDTGKCGEGVNWEYYNNGDLVITGSGAMWNFDSDNPGYMKYYKDITALYFDETVDTIGNLAFSGLNNLSYVELPEYLKNIGKRAFSGTGITEISLGALNSIGEMAFNQCFNLKTIHFTDSAPNSIADDAFTWVTATVYYPAGDETWTSAVMQNYGGDITWKVNATGSGECGSYLKWVLDGTGTLTISGTGEMWNFSDTFQRPWKAYGNAIKTVIISSGVTSIGDYAFVECRELTKVIISGTVTSIGDYAFEVCTGIESIDIPDSVTDIGNYAFYMCSALKNISLPSGLQEISLGTFADCIALPGISIPDSVTSIGSEAFTSCKALKSIIIPNGIKSIAPNTFNNCISLESISIPNSVQSIEQQAFINCTALKSVTIPNSVQSIAQKAFYNCVALKSVTIPGSVKSIGKAAFSACAELLEVIINSGVESIEDDVFSYCSKLANVTFSNGINSIGNYSFSGCKALTGITLPDSLTSIGRNAFENCTGLTSIKFEGNAPRIDNNAFYRVTATAYCPAGNATWTSDKQLNYGGTITWTTYLLKTAPVITTVANHADYMIVTWNKVEGAVTYKLAYREGSGAWTFIDVPLYMVDSKGNPRVNLKDLKQGANYTFIAYAYFEDGSQTKSASATQTRLLTPTVTAKAGVGYVNLTWNSVEGGSQYKIYYREKGGSWQLYAWVKKDVTSINIKESVINANRQTPLIKGHTYEFAVILGTSVAGITSGFPTNPTAIVY